MTVAVIVLAVACMVLALAVNAVLAAHRRESDAWAKERKQLIDRIIAKHTGEVIALDRDTQPKAAREPSERVLVEGLS